ncbi:MAG: alpha-amylase family glycosyl hydrolase [Protaetiibacter sp.]
MLLTSAKGALALELGNDGTPSAIVSHRASGSIRLPLSVAVELSVGGRERRGAVGGIVYEDTARIASPLVPVGDAPAALHEIGADGEVFVVDTALGDWGIRWRWIFRQGGGPGVTLELAVTPPATGERRLRSMTVTIGAELGALGSAGWRVEAPGNLLRRGTRFAELPARTDISPAGGLRGSAALVWAGHDSGAAFTMWPLCRTEIGELTLHRLGDTLELRYDTGLAGEPEPGEALLWGDWHLDLAEGDWEQALDAMPAWYQAIGLSAPQERPEWIEGASIYEVQLGYSVFWGGHRYAPYPTARELIDDLPRIAGLGFTVVQIMPRQPYPSYNVHDYDDVSTSYGPEAEIAALVARCHELGIRVLLDVLMHGVLDHASIAAAAAGVRGGPYAAHLDEQLGDTFRGELSEQRASAISWSRHILDFEPFWTAGSPERSALLDEHPDWFFRDSAGTVLGVYTHAFDARIRGWQDWFIAAIVRLAGRLDVDGFRIDAPTYNNFGNWSPATRHRASASSLAAVELFRRVRPALKALKPDFLLYTEPSGVALRESMDLNYNYDEQWLVSAVAEPEREKAGWTVTTAQDLAAWIADRDRSLPPGSLTAHHIDSHDTFWWPDWGRKWRRQQFGIGVTAALTAVFLLCPGPYMVFTGGEEGIEETLRALHRMTAAEPALRSGAARAGRVVTDSAEIFCLERVLGDRVAVVLVNLAADERRFRVEFADGPSGAWRELAGAGGELRPDADGRLELTLPAFGFTVLVPALTGE